MASTVTVGEEIDEGREKWDREEGKEERGERREGGERERGGGRRERSREWKGSSVTVKAL